MMCILLPKQIKLSEPCCECSVEISRPRILGSWCNKVLQLKRLANLS